MTTARCHALPARMGKYVASAACALSARARRQRCATAKKGSWGHHAATNAQNLGGHFAVGMASATTRLWMAQQHASATTNSPEQLAHKIVLGMKMAPSAMAMVNVSSKTIKPFASAILDTPARIASIVFVRQRTRCSTQRRPGAFVSLDTPVAVDNLCKQKQKQQQKQNQQQKLLLQLRSQTILRSSLSDHGTASLKFTTRRSQWQ